MILLSDDLAECVRKCLPVSNRVGCRGSESEIVNNTSVSIDLNTHIEIGFGVLIIDDDQRRVLGKCLVGCISDLNPERILLG